MFSFGPTGKTLCHMSTDGIFPPRWRTTTPMTSCCSAPAATPPPTCTTVSWSSSWPTSSPPLKAARRESACWRTRTDGGCARRLGLCSPPGACCRSSGERSCRLWSRASWTWTRRKSWRTRRWSRLPGWRRGERQHCWLCGHLFSLPVGLHQTGDNIISLTNMFFKCSCNLNSLTDTGLFSFFYFLILPESARFFYIQLLVTLSLAVWLPGGEWIVQTRPLTAPLSSWRIFNEAYVPHGLKVVQAHAEQGLQGLMDLERRWRQHFLTTMHPRHLPPLWSVDHNHSKFLRKYGEDLPIKLNWLSASAKGPRAATDQVRKLNFLFCRAKCRFDLKKSTATLNFTSQITFLFLWADEWTDLPAGTKILPACGGW